VVVVTGVNVGEGRCLVHAVDVDSRCGADAGDDPGVGARRLRFWRGDVAVANALRAPRRERASGRVLSRIRRFAAECGDLATERQSEVQS